MSAAGFDPLRQPLTEHAFVPRGNFDIAYPRGWHLRMHSDQTITAISARRRDAEQSTLNRPSQVHGVQIQLEHQPPSVWLNRVFPGGLPYSAPVGSGAVAMLPEYMLRGNLHVRAAGAYLGMLEPMQIGPVYALGADADADMFHLRGPTSHGWIDGYIVTRGAQILLAYVHAPSLRSLHRVDWTWHAMMASIDSAAQRRSALE